MKITSISLAGFCNIKHIDIQLTDFNALVAPNNYGKSNVIDGIRFAFDFITTSEDERRQMMGDAAYIPINIATSGEPFRFGMVFTHSDGLLYSYTFAFDWQKTNGEHGACIIEESLSKFSEERHRQSSLIKRTEKDGGMYVSSPKARCNKSVGATKQQLAIDRLALINGLFFGDVVSELRKLSIHMVGTATLDKQSLCEFIYRLKEQHNDRYSLLEDAVMHMVPNIMSITPARSHLGIGNGDVPYLIEDSIYDLRVSERNNNQDISISRLSSGSRRIITIIAEIVKAEMDGSSLICIEELENSVHPKLLENMILMVQSFAEGITVVTTSHSPYLVRYLKSRHLTFGLPTEEGTASFHKIKPSKVKTVVKRASAMDLTLGEYMFELMLGLKPESEEITELFEGQPE